MLHSIRQFIEALQDPYGLTRTLGEIEVCRSSDGEPLRWVGNSAVVFKIRCGGRYKMLKCYTRPMEHLEAIYQEKLLRQELYVWQADGQGEWCDVVIDDWIEGITLYEAVMRGAGSGDKAHLSNLARQFDRLALELLESDWAHGDLKPENILLDESGTLRPVDFDAMFLPVFAGEKSPELGTAAYQHPGRTAEDFDASIDDYSIATISTTLHALALEPGLLARYNRGEGLLLSPRKIVRHGCAAHAECLALFEKAGDCTAPQKLDTFGVFFMKYNYEIRLKAVKLVLEGGLSVREAGCHLGCGRSQVHLWVTLFERHGLAGLKLRHGSYSAEFKLSVLKHMHQNHLSLLETAVHFGIPGPFVIRQWERLYQNQGAEGLRRKPQRRRPAMSKSKTKKVKLKTTPHEELLKELEYLRAENAYLKKLQALVEERIVRESGKEPKPSKD